MAESTAVQQSSRPTDGDWLGTKFLRFTGVRMVIKSRLDNYIGLYDRIGMQTSLGAPESIEGLTAFKERRSPNWVHPALKVDGRL